MSTYRKNTGVSRRMPQRGTGYVAAVTRNKRQPTWPQREGTMKSFVLLQYWTKLHQRLLSASLCSCFRNANASEDIKHFRSGGRRREHVRAGRLGNSYTRAVQVFRQSTVELVQPAQFQVRHTLFLIFDIAARTDFIGWRH